MITEGGGGNVYYQNLDAEIPLKFFIEEGNPGPVCDLTKSIQYDLSQNGSSPNGLMTVKTKQKTFGAQISSQWNTSEKISCAMWGPAISTVIIRTSDDVMARGGTVSHLSNWVPDS